MAPAATSGPVGTGHQGETNTYSVLFPLYLLLAVHAWYLAKHMPEEPA